MRALLLAALLHAAAAETRFRDDYTLRAPHDPESVEVSHQVRRRASLSQELALNHDEPNLLGGRGAIGAGIGRQGARVPPYLSPLLRVTSPPRRLRSQVKLHVGDAHDHPVGHKVRPAPPDLPLPGAALMPLLVCRAAARAARRPTRRAEAPDATARP